MDTADLVDSKVVFYFTQFWSFLTVSLVGYLLGVASKRVVRIRVPEGFGPDGRLLKQKDWAAVALPTWFKLWAATLDVHAAAFCSLAGLTSLPAADWVPDSAIARMAWFGLAGMISSWIFTTLQRFFDMVPGIVRGWLGKRGGASDPPPATVSDPGEMPKE